VTKRYCWSDYSYDEQKKLVQDIYYWQYGDQLSFTSVLFTLIQKSSPENLSKIRQGFESHVQVYIQWQLEEECGDALFKAYRVGKFARKDV